MAAATSFYDLTPKDKKGEPFSFAEHLKGKKAVLIVNVASKCGFTSSNYPGLQKLYDQYKDRGLEIVAFPSNQFGSQEPGSNDEIQSFCQLNYGVSFPVLGKIDVNGDHTDPVYQYLKHEKPGIMGLERIKWNFEKFLVKDGKVVGRWASTTKPESLSSAIEEALA